MCTFIVQFSSYALADLTLKQVYTVTRARIFYNVHSSSKESNSFLHAFDKHTRYRTLYIEEPIILQWALIYPTMFVPLKCVG